MKKHMVSAFLQDYKRVAKESVAHSAFAATAARYAAPTGSARSSGEKAG